MIRSPLKYFGAKWRLVPWLLEHMPEHVCYVEPFGGSAALLLSKPRSRVEVYNDIDGAVVEFFATLRDNGEELARLVELTPCSRVEHAKAFEDTEDRMERVRRFLVRSWQTVGGYRRGGSGSWSYSMADTAQSQASRWATVPERLRVLVERLQGVAIENEDALNVLRRYDRSTTLYYVDPPYHTDARSWARYQHDLDRDEHTELLATLTSLEAMVMLSGYPTEEYSEALQGWQCHTRETRTLKNQPRIECLWLNPSALSALSPQLELFGGVL